MPKKKAKPKSKTSTPKSKTSNKSTSTPKKTSRIDLLPVMDPKFNAREMVKQSCMLEDHLNNATKRCCDCIKKHFLTLEGLAEEAPSLECAKYACPNVLKSCGATIRTLHQTFEHTPKNERPQVFPVIAGRLRQLRKKLMQDNVKIPLDKMPEDERKAVVALRKEALSAKGVKTKKTKKTSSTRTRRRRAAPAQSRR